MNTFQELGIDAQLFYRQTIICHSQTEADAFLKTNRHRFDADTRVMITGYSPDRELLDGVRGKVGLVFGNDLLGSLWDIKVAGWLNKHEIKLYIDEGSIFVSWRNAEFRFAAGDGLTLNAFERASGFRAGVRTYKPKGYASFLEQLKKS